MTAEIEADELIDAASRAAREAGQILRDWAGRFTVREKGRADLVTEADHAAQAAIHERIRRQFPQHGFLGEEGLEETAPGGRYRWIIDPLDGTSNYVHGFPFYAVSIGIEDQGELIGGAIYDPSRDELFTAARGQGTCLNGKPVTTSGTEPLGEAMLMASLPVGTRRDDPAIARFLKLLPRAQTVQRSGSAALNLSYVACGRIDGFWSSSLKPWDMAAGVVLVREAGGVVTKMDGQTFQVGQPDLLATASPALHSEVSAALLAE